MEFNISSNIYCLYLYLFSTLFMLRLTINSIYLLRSSIPLYVKVLHLAPSLGTLGRPCVQLSTMFLGLAPSVGLQRAKG